MNYRSIPLWTPFNNIIVPTTGVDHKNVCFFFWGENVDFFEIYNSLNISSSNVKYYFQPTIVRPFQSYMTASIKKEVVSYKLKPVWALMGNYSALKQKNFFYDTSKYLNMVDQKKHYKKYNAGQAFDFYQNFLNVVDGVDKNLYERTLLYCVNLDKPLNDLLNYKKFFPIYYKLLEYFKGEITSLPFDKIIMFVTSKEHNIYIKLFDINEKHNNIQKIRNIVMKVKNKDENDESETFEKDIVNTVLGDSDHFDEVSKDKMNTAVNHFINSDNNISKSSNELLNSKHIKNLAVSSLLYASFGDAVKSKLVADKIQILPEEKQKEIINNLGAKVLEKYPIQSVANNIAIKIAKTHEMTNYVNPSHIMNKRKLDFKELHKDIKDAFKVLENKDIPLKIKSITSKKIESSSSEIYKTVKNRFFVELIDKDGGTHTIHIDVPYLEQDGTFQVNGMRKIMINQLVRFPIFFSKPSEARFESSYSVMKLLSKTLQKGAYFIIFLGTYKPPLALFLANFYGLSDCLNMFDIKYTIEEK